MASTVLKMKPDVEKLNTGIKAADRKNIAKDLSALLADTMHLQLKSQICHWNVVGPLFKPIHELTEAHYQDLFRAADVIAERIRALGHLAPQGTAEVLPKSALDHGKTLKSISEMVEQLASEHEAIVRRLRQAAASAEEADDFVTHDMLTARLAFHEKAIWMLRATVAE